MLFWNSMEKEYWFYVDSFIHMSVKNNDILLYNSYNGKILEYRDKPRITALLSRLKSKHNLWVTGISISELEYPEIANFVKDIKSSFMGDVLDSSFSDGKPVQMPPYVKIQKDIKYLKKISSLTVGERIIDYLSEISIYVNEACSIGCHYCKQAYRQFPCCHSNAYRKTGRRDLEFQALEELFKEISGTPLENINILGGNLLDYPALGKLTGRINRLAVSHTYYFHYLNIAGREGLEEWISTCDPDKSQFTVLASFPLDKEKFRQVYERVKKFTIDCRFLFIIEGVEDFDKLEALQSEHSDINPIIRLFFNGGNHGLFEECAFINRQTIENRKPSLKDIYINQSINRFFFGKITVFPDGGVYADVNRPAIGRLGKDSIYEILFKEMGSRNSWRRVRKNAVQCRSCNFADLCPPLSNYNTALRRNNLCTIMK